MSIATLLTTSEAAERLRVHPGTLSRWVRTGEGPAPTQANGKRLFREDVLSEWLSARTSDPHVPVAA